MKKILLNSVLLCFLCTFTLQAQKRLSEMIIEFYDDDTDEFYLSGKEQYFYFGNGNLKETVGSYWDMESATWTVTSRQHKHYNAAGQLIEEVYAGLDSTSTISNIYRRVYNWNGGKMLSETNYYWKNNGWSLEDKTDYTYSGNLITSGLSQEMTNGTWVNDERFTATYNNQKIAMVTSEEYEDNMWQLDGRTEFTRNGAGKIIELIETEWNGSAFIFDFREVNAWDAAGNLMSETYYDVDATYNWKPERKTEYTYDLSELMSDYFNPFNPQEHFESIGAEDRQFHNKVLSSITSDYESDGPLKGKATWEISHRTTYVYAEDTMGVEDKLDQNFVVVFPNPVSHQLNLKFKAPINGQAKIMDLQGRVVQVQKLNNLHILFEMESLSSGQYLLNIDSDRGVISRRISKN